MLFLCNFYLQYNLIKSAVIKIINILDCTYLYKLLYFVNIYKMDVKNQSQNNSAFFCDFFFVYIQRGSLPKIFFFLLIDFHNKNH